MYLTLFNERTTKFSFGSVEIIRLQIIFQPYSLLLLNSKPITAMCNFSINYPKPKDQLVSQLKAAILSQGNAQFEGDQTRGEFAFTAMSFNIAGGYAIVEDVIDVNITDKPFLVSCSRIESEIRRYLGA
jgi:hypothetical protein